MWEESHKHCSKGMLWTAKRGCLSMLILEATEMIIIAMQLKLDSKVLLNTGGVYA